MADVLRKAGNSCIVDEGLLQNEAPNLPAQSVYEIYIILIAMVLNFQPGAGQKKNDLKILKLSWDNDFFNLRGEGTDRGYTNGLNLEVYYTKHVPPRFLSKLLMTVNDSSDNIYGWGLTQKLYTPIDISKEEIQAGDRPYAGVLFLSHVLISSDHVKKQKLTTSVSFGVIGKYAFGEEVQTWVHDLIHYQRPKGWDNQIANDIVLTYYINYEKKYSVPQGTWKYSAM